MCGIAGIIDAQRPADDLRGTVARMTATLVHRGPDDEGCFVDDGVAIGMRRLSIVDVAGGRQPVSTEDGRIQVVFNGEIYNYAELRAGLIARGHTLRTHSDTEVIAHLYEERGPDCLDDLRGMFAIALWDGGARRVMLARDRLGKKPLFYAHHGRRLLFGSEIKALLAADPALAEPDPAALVPYLRFGFVPQPGTMYRRIRKLPAAHALTFDGTAVRVARYWHLRVGDDARAARTPHQWAEELDARLAEAVCVRLVSEVPLGVFLSGGLDSSAIVAYAHRAGLHPLKTFTIGFDRPQWDESTDARAVADHFGTDHHVLTLREADLTARLPDTLLELVRHFDEPCGDASALPAYHVSRLARQAVTVILSGDGGDELFAGYRTYRGIAFAERYRRLPSWLAASVLPALADGLAAALPRGRRYAAQRAGRVLRDSVLPFAAMYLRKISLCRSDTLRALLPPNLAAGIDDDPHAVLPADVLDVLSADLPAVTRATLADLRLRLLDGMLVKVDRMSMAHSLEVRSPFLDHRLVEFVATMPAALKLRGGRTKAILRDVLRPQLPARTMRKPKQGFEVPLREWLRRELADMVGDYLSPSAGRLPSGVFDTDAVSRLVREHRDGTADHSTVIWLLLNYAAWHDLYVGRGRRPAVGESP